MPAPESRQDLAATLWAVAALVLALALSYRSLSTPAAGPSPVPPDAPAVARVPTPDGAGDLFPAVRLTAAESFRRLTGAGRTTDNPVERQRALARLDAAVDLAVRPPGAEFADPAAEAKAWRSIRAGLTDALN